jgi:hypothetical protein
MFQQLVSNRAGLFALALGTFDGMKTWRVRPKEMRENENVDENPQYYSVGYVVGTLLQLLVFAVAGKGLNLL